MLGQRLKELREQNGYTQTWVAEQLGLSRSGYSQYESGARRPDVDTLVRISRIYGVSMDFLIFGADSDNAESDYIVSKIVSVVRRLEPEQFEALKQFLATI